MNYEWLFLGWLSVFFKKEITVWYARVLLLYIISYSFVQHRACKFDWFSQRLGNLFFIFWFTDPPILLLWNWKKKSCMRIRGKKCSFFEKFGVLCFLETPVLRLALLPYYRQHIGPYGDFLSKSKRLSGMSSGRPWQIILLSGDPQRHF